MTQSTETVSVSPSRPQEDQQREVRPLTLWERISFTTTHHSLALLSKVIGLGGLYHFGRAFGTLEWLVNYKRRRRYRKALKRVFGDEMSKAERKRTTREHFCQTRCDKILYLILDTLSREKATSLLTIENREILDQCVERGRGGFFAYSHHGPLHVVSVLITMYGYKTVAVRDNKESAIRRFVHERLDRKYSEFSRMRFIFNDSFPREIFRCYKEGYLLGSAMDATSKRHPNQKAEEAIMFGESRPFLTGPFHIALRSGAPVYQGFAIADRNFKYRFRVPEMLLDPDKIEDREAAIIKAVERYAANVESLIRSQPSLITKP
ncbi:MAG: lysophospholipid acyltransferase family protein [Planctomycetota bacterium]